MAWKVSLTGMATVLLLGCASQTVATPTANPPLATPGQADFTAVPTGAVELMRGWKLLNGTVAGAQIDLIADAPVTLTVRGVRLTGQSACNNYQADVRIDGADFALGDDVAMSAMGCETARMLVDNAYMRALVAVRSWNVTQGKLSLRGPGVELVFEPIGASPSSP
jgi:heat shock protein HslJ